jgi:hypothetical protein
MMLKSEMLFVDPAVSDLAAILGGLRPEVEAIVLDSSRPAARQVAERLRGRRGLKAMHVIAHGAQGRVRFAAGEWSAETVAGDADDLASIGCALFEGGDLRLWSCHTGAGAEGADFVTRLARATGAHVAAATHKVGAAALGGVWALAMCANVDAALPPLSEGGLASYSGVLGDYLQIDTHGAPVTLDASAYSLVAKINGRTQVIGRFSVLKGHPHNMLVEVTTIQPNYTVYAGPNGDLRDGQLTIYDSSGNYSQQAASTLLGADGAAVTIRSIASPRPGPRPTASAGIDEQPLPPANSRATQ